MYGRLSIVFTASRAILYIDPLPNGEEVQITMRLEGGFKFPRTYKGAVEAGIAETEYGPIVMNTQEQLQQAFDELKQGNFLK